MFSKFNPAGVYLTTDGRVFQDKELTLEIQPRLDSRGYQYIPGIYLNKKTGNKEIENGFFLHRMMVLTFGDRNGKEYYDGCVIDHVNMKHDDNRVDNLEIVNDYINLARAVRGYPDDPGCRERYEAAMAKLCKESPEVYGVIKASIIADACKYPATYLGTTDGAFTIRRDDDEEDDGEADTVCVQ